MDLRTLVLIVNFVYFVTAEQARGDTCTHEETGSQGICKYVAECEEALQIISHGLQPQSCSFEGFKAIVCCPLQQEEEKKKANETGKSDEENKKKIESRIPGQIAKEKCKEYSQYVRTSEPNPTTLLDSVDIIRNDCPFNVTELIVGGMEASEKEFPHMVLVGYDLGDGVTKWSCGGSLISEEFVLTAAHCLDDRQLGPAKYAKMGFIDQNDEKHVQKFNIVERIPHPDYVIAFNEYDIALLKLHQKANLNPWVRPACLYTESLISKSNAIASGWGKVGIGKPSKVLLKVVLQFFDRDHCHPFFKLSKRFHEGINDTLVVCAGSPEGNKDTCKGDSGGPLQINNQNDPAIMNCMYDIVGIISGGFGCENGLPVPATYTRVSYFTKWIEDIVWPSS